MHNCSSSSSLSPQNLILHLPTHHFPILPLHLCPPVAQSYCPLCVVACFTVLLCERDHHLTPQPPHPLPLPIQPSLQEINDQGGRWICFVMFRFLHIYSSPRHQRTTFALVSFRIFPISAGKVAGTAGNIFALHARIHPHWRSDRKGSPLARVIYYCKLPRTHGRLGAPASVPPSDWLSQASAVPRSTRDLSCRKPSV